MLGPDRFVSDVLARHGAVLALDQGVVGRTVRSRFGELGDQQLVEQPGDGYGPPAADRLLAYFSRF